MVFFKGKRKDAMGENVYVYKDELGTTEIKKLHMADYLFTGDQWCPNCHVKCAHHVEDEYYECTECNWSITDEEAEDDGYPSEASTYEDDFGY